MRVPWSLAGVLKSQNIHDSSALTLAQEHSQMSVTQLLMLSLCTSAAEYESEIKPQRLHGRVELSSR